LVGCTRWEFAEQGGDLLFGLPRYLLAPCCYVSLRDDSSISISVFTITFQRFSEENPLVLPETFKGVRKVFSLAAHRPCAVPVFHRIAPDLAVHLVDVGEFLPGPGFHISYFLSEFNISERVLPKLK